MNAPTETSGSRKPTGAGELGRQVTTGFAFMLLQTVGVRFARFGGSFVLAWLLFPDDFALFGLASTLPMFVAVIRSAGLKDILISRREKLHRWVNPAVWMSATIGFGCGLFLVLAAPLLGWFFQRTEVVGLILIFAITIPIQSLTQVPEAILLSKLRFKRIAMIEAGSSVLLLALTIYYAWCGLGAISFVLPMLNVALLRAAYVWSLVRPRVQSRPELKRWKYLYGESIRLISADFARTLAFQADYLILGRAMPSQPVVGHYYYAFQLSNQTTMLLARNLDTVLFPALSSIGDDPERHARAAVRVLRSMAVLGIPLCFCQAAGAEPLVHAVLPERFYPSIPFMIILSIGMAPRLLMPLCSALIRSKARFRTLSVLSWVFAGSVVTLAITGVTLYGAIGLACAVSFAFAFSTMIFLWSALHGLGNIPRTFVSILTLPLLGGGASAITGWYISTLLPSDGVVQNLIRLGVVVIVTALIYAPLVILFERDIIRDMSYRVRKLVRRKHAQKSA